MINNSTKKANALVLSEYMHLIEKQREEANANCKSKTEMSPVQGVLKSKDDSELTERLTKDDSIVEEYNNHKSWNWK